MGRTHEALQWAEKEFEAKRQEGLLPKLLSEPQGSPPRRELLSATLKPYGDLQTSLLSRYPQGSVKTILVSGMGHGAGASTTAVNFATALARNGGFKVLLIDANLRTPSLHDVFDMEFAQGLSDFVMDGREMLPFRAEPENLHVICCGRLIADPVALLGSNEFDQFLKRMRAGYDFVVMDAPPINGSAECRVLCNRVDGVVLVIEAGKTRRHAAASAKDQVEKAGGRLLGVVINKRRHYIPEFIYKRL
jgi:non-specific protein-tyrosine kinase